MNKLYKTYLTRSKKMLDHDQKIQEYDFIWRSLEKLYNFFLNQADEFVEKQLTNESY